MIRKAVFLATAAAISMMCINAKAAENVCAKPEIAKGIMDQYNGLGSHNLNKAIDIINLVTIGFRDKYISCHGYFEVQSGPAVEGTITIRPNVAGDMIVVWSAEDLNSAMWSSVIDTRSEKSPNSPSADTAQSSSFSDGARDRQAWEVWFNGLSGEERDGAYYWAAQRSLSHPGSCTRLGGEGQIGCLEAKIRLDQSDARRKSDPLYKAGWNGVQSNS